ncbi:uncharacterized protein J8A68_001354 [[Candida] subhashii]|uniref:Major facilitator superfamily (MFS) profile domain-containing protein n=1 Tax=[Candida] subhashii TaxID=561895 RepID=A0A8J5UZV7_9ASCO|nr:uncharacterized protein J8A68_001354 [[Candida] subhashii]KAG7665045.1 hypothetical protein J8A68_001354 [[Candida] subhashii]
MKETFNNNDNTIHTTKSIDFQPSPHIIQKPCFHWPVIRTYLKTRFTGLWVGKEEFSKNTWNDIFNPFQQLVHLNKHHWNFFLLGFFAWAWDAFDYFTTALNISNIAESLDVSIKQVSWGLTLVLMLRTIGAIIFGAMGDMRGRKWPYIINLGLLIIIQIGTGFVKTYAQFLGTRATFGVAMGGLYGICAAEALSDAPTAARGVLSGIFQQGYAFGFLLATICQRALTYTTPHGWRSLFWFSAGPPVLLIIWRLFTPETDSYQRIKERFEAGALEKNSKAKEFKAQAKVALKHYWLVIIFMVFMMSGFNFSAHGSQDLYPTLLEKQYHFGEDRRTVILVCAKLGAIVGGLIIGHVSSVVGRRSAILIANLFTIALTYPWAYKPMWATAFFMQFGVQGAWGVVPSHLSELSPPQFRAFVTGVSYQLGNLASSATSTIQATLSEKFPIDAEDEVYDYSKTLTLFVLAVQVFIMIVVFFGPENRNADLNAESESVYATEEDSADDKSKESDLKNASDRV